MTPESNRNIGHSIFQRLLNRAKTDRIDFNLLLLRYGVERFLYRLSISPYSESFVLKGASLFNVWQGQNYRVTKDADLLGAGEWNSEELFQIFKDICLLECPVEEGIAYPVEWLKTDAIMDHRAEVGVGVRATLTGLLHTAHIPLQIDIGFGDIITPNPEIIQYPSLLDEPSPCLKAYPPCTVVAEKLEAIVKLGLANSRMKDFYDIWLLSRLFDFDGKTLRQSISNTFLRRGTLIPAAIPFAFTVGFYLDEQKQRQWKAFIRKSVPDESGSDLSHVMKDIILFVMPVVEAAAKDVDFDARWVSSAGWSANTEKR